MSTALRPSRWTLRTKLVSSVVLLFVVIIMAIGALTVWQLQRTLADRIDQQLVTSAQQLAGPATNRGDPLSYQGGGGNSLRVDLSGGNVVLVEDMQSGLFRPSALINRLGAPPTALSGAQIEIVRTAGIGDHPSTIGLGRAGDYRVIAVSHVARLQNQATGQYSPQTVTTIVGLPLADTYSAVRRAALAVALLSGAGLILVGLATAYLVRRSLEPLRRVAETATRVSTLPLSAGEVVMHERVDLADTDERTEVGQVGLALNQMLDNVDGALTARQESETRVRQFVADASHELRTPLASIRGYAELSRREREPVPTGVQHAMSRIESESDRMTALVEDLLLLARLDSGRPLDREPVDVTLLAMETMSDAHAAGPGHRWKLDLPDEPMEVVGDEARIRQVLINLLANARRHTPEGTEVTTRVAADGGDVVVSVSDDGPGIEPSLLPHIFERFTRGDSARTRTEGSTGLGLSIVHAVVTAHGGDLRVQSVPGRTTFTMRMRRSPQETPASMPSVAP
ncbi:cell wall metabolism sensor histidine kinase WalK [Allobranchiibius sp. GilTou73]|uniref:sensor histidine kinase n=1 Tax=Allobranchiibius sp. GilTou73 TaxID=2904523 RepID=UPI001F2108D5|nr:HAMP domain-containing sensor histidine kinase [Allobranchiibius sp. GilTou73]UIJ35212.1 HAMP domain-containing histidine kinase [Allobranchiibius sp. GilTou73]